MAQVNIGAIKFNWKGPYNNSTAYVVDDVVSSGGSSYVCILASQGNAVSSGTYWQIMSSAGTNGTDGTDVGATLANKEIAFKLWCNCSKLDNCSCSFSSSRNKSILCLPQCKWCCYGFWC